MTYSLKREVKSFFKGILVELTKPKPYIIAVIIVAYEFLVLWAFGVIK